jgi:glycerone phosphate O-acyltransferase
MTLPSHVKRLVVLEGSRSTLPDVVLAASRNPLVSGLSEVVAISSSHIELARSAAFLAAAKRLGGKLMLAGAGTPPEFAIPHFVPNAASDLFLLFAGSSSVMQDYSAKLQCLPQTESGTLLLICDDEEFPSLMSTIKAVLFLSSWRVIICRVPFHSPPDIAEESLAFSEELCGPLENVCLGIAMGVTRQLKVNASQPAGIVPANISINVGLLSTALFLSNKLPPSLHATNEFVVKVSARPDESLVWGMVGEYIVDYYGRFSREIGKAMPANLFNPDPTLDFAAHFADWWNFGIGLTTPVQLYRRYSSRSHRSHLKKFPYSSTSDRVNTVLRNFDRAVAALPPPSSRIQEAVKSAANTVAGRELAAFRSPPSTDLDSSTYLSLVRIVSREKTLISHLPLISLEWVQWEMYVKRVCVSVLNYVAAYILQHDAAIPLPRPLPLYHNDLVFVGVDRAPEPNFVLRQVFPDLHWGLRCGLQQNGNYVALRAGGTDSRRLAILAQPHIQLLMSQLSREQHVTKTAVEERAHTILRGIGDKLNHQELRTLAYVIRKVFRTLYDRINLNTEAFQRLFAAFKMPRRSVVIIPAHRSYVDFLVISYVLIQLGLPVPHICSGEDFLRLGKIAELMRGSGAFFMRRSFRGDKLYGALFREYVRHLVRDGECIEFFIEGMRSRTGKAITPKIGILKFVTDAFFEKQDEVDDVLFVPVGLSYERLLEGNVYSEELLGVPKPKETVGNLLKSSSILRSNYGSLNVEVGEAISLKSFSDDPFQCPDGFSRAPSKKRDRISGSATAASVGGFASYTPPETLDAVAWRISYEIQENIVVTPTALLAAAIQCTLNINDLLSGVPAALCASNMERIRSSVLRRRAKMNPQFATSDGSMLLTHALQLFAPRLWLSPLSHVFVNTEMMVTTQMLMSIYCNQLIHIFADEAVISVAVRAFGIERTTSQDHIEAGHDARTSEGTCGDFLITAGALIPKLHFVRRLLCFELPNFQPSSPISFESWLDRAFSVLHDDKVLTKLPLTVAEDEELLFSRNPHFSFVAQLIYPLIESIFVTFLSFVACLHSGRVKIDETTLMRLTHEGALLLHKQQFNPFICSSSKENIKNAMNVLVDSKICHVESSPTMSYCLMSGAEPLLQQRVQEINAIRWRVHTAAGVASGIDVLKQVLFSFSTNAKL